MMLPRLKPSAVVSVNRAVGVVARREASHAHGKDVLEPFREINRLANEGKWDAINNSPRMFLFGLARQEANAVYGKIATPEDSFSKYGGQPYGPIVFLVTRVLTCLGIVIGGGVLYESVVPEKYRLHYKYAPKHDHHHDEEHH